MAYPTKYVRQYDYFSYQNANPTRPLPGDKVNIDFDYLVDSIDDVVEFQKLIQRSDGVLANGIVGVDQLDTVLAAAFGDLSSIAEVQALTDAAAASATAAASSATAAATSASAASTSATDAASSATAAASSATDAAASAAAAEAVIVSPSFVGLATDFGTVDPGSRSYLMTTGYIGDGDGGAALLAKTPGAAGTEIGYLEDVNSAPWIAIGPYYTPEMDGAKNDGSADTRASIQKIIDNEGSVYLGTPGATYRIDARIDVLNTGGIRGLVGAGGKRPKIYMPAAAFTNTGSGTQTGTNAVGIKVSGLTTGLYTPVEDVELRDFILQSEVADSRVINGIYALNVKNIRISNVEIYGLPVGAAIKGGSLVGGSISGCHIHDMTDDDGSWGFNPESTGIEIDNDLVNNIYSERLSIVGNQIEDITQGATSIAAFGYQTNGIKVVSHIGYVPKLFDISGNRIKSCAQGIDFYGDMSVISRNVVSTARLFGISLKHGATKNGVTSNIIYYCGKASILLSGGDAGEPQCADNVVGFNECFSVNPWSDYADPHDTGCVLITDGVALSTNNLVIGNRLVPSGGGYAINRHGAGSNHLIANHTASGASAEIYDASSDAGRTQPVIATVVRAHTTAGVTVASGATSTLVFDAKDIDRRSEYSTSTGRFTALSAGDYDVKVQVRISIIASTKEVNLSILKNNSTIVSSYNRTFSATSSDIAFSDVIALSAGDFIEITVSHTDASTVTIGASGHTFFSVKPAA